MADQLFPLHICFINHLLRNRDNNLFLTWVQYISSMLTLEDKQDQMLLKSTMHVASKNI